MPDARLVVGAGGTGRTAALRELVAASGEPAEVITASPLAPLTADDVARALGSEIAVLAVDDVQWSEPGALDALLEAADRVTVIATRRPATGGEPASHELERLAERLSRSEPPIRLGLLDDDGYGPALAEIRTRTAERAGAEPPGAVATAEAEALLRATGGSVGLTADAVATGWPGSGPVTGDLADAVMTRVRRAGPMAATLVAAWSVDGLDGAAENLPIALAALGAEADPERAEREARAGGLIDATGDLIPLVRESVAAAATVTELAHLHDLLATALAERDQRRAADHLLAGAGHVPGADRILAGAALDAAVTDPETAPAYIDRAEQLGLAATDGSVLRALAAFHAGSADALAHLEAALSTAPEDDRSAILGFGIDVRDLRLADAGQRALAGDLAEPLQAMADGMAGRPRSVEAARTPLAKSYAAVATGIDHLGRGAVPEAVGAFSIAADDFDRLRPTAPIGITPHAVGALSALVVGDLAVVDILTSQALEHRSGGRGEHLSHELIGAYGRLVAGDYGPALVLLRAHGNRAADEDLDDAVAETEHPASGDDAATPEVTRSQRDRLLLASLGAAVARRSGDTARLRAAWHGAERALLRPSACWLVIDPFTELLAAGARLGDRRRVDPVVDQLLAQTASLPTDGPGPVAGQWLRLQIGIAAEDHELVADAASRMAELAPIGDRSKARVAAAGIWAGLLPVAGDEGSSSTDRPTEDDVVMVAETLMAIDDGWEASRLLGQAALDEPDSKAARRMLELARISVSEHVDTSTGDGLAALGLSEREAEVALLVVEGRTHKEVGAQLFISPKTVEHHVAKIRQKIGASSRAELLSIIREAVGKG